MGPRMCTIDGGADCPAGRGNFGSRYGAAHCNQLGICGVAGRERVK